MLSDFKKVVIILLTCSSLFSCKTQKLCKQYNAVNGKKLAVVYIVENNNEKKEFTNRQKWKKYCDSLDLLGYSILTQHDKPFTGNAFYYTKKASALFTYTNGFIDGKYTYYNSKGNILIDGIAGVDTSSSWKGFKDNAPAMHFGLGRYELSKERREYVIQEAIYNEHNHIESFFINDSIQYKRTELHDDSVPEWEEVFFEKENQYKYVLRTNKNGDTLYYQFISDSLNIYMNIDGKFHYYYSNTDVSNNFYREPKSFYKLDKQIREWGTLYGAVVVQSEHFDLKMTLKKDTLEYVKKVNGKYHGLLHRLTPKGDTIEKIPFDNGQLHGTWVKFDYKGDTLFYRNFLNGKEHGKSFGQDNGTYIEENFVNGFLDGKVLIYNREQYGNKVNSDEKYLREEFYMKDGLKHGTHIKYDVLGVSAFTKENNSMLHDIKGFLKDKPQTKDMVNNISNIKNFVSDTSNIIIKEKYYTDTLHDIKNSLEYKPQTKDTLSYRFNTKINDVSCIIVKEKLEYYKGMLHGVCQYFNNGMLYLEKQYEYDKLNGIYKTYYLDGNLNTLGQYKNDKKTGLWIYYNQDGSVKNTENY